MPQAASKPQAAISDVAVRLVQEPVSKRAYTIVTIETSAGVTGFGEFPGRPNQGNESARLDMLKRRLSGLDAAAAEVVRQALAGSHGGDRMQAAVNQALLDILGKLTKAPVFEVLGGPTRQKARALAGLDGNSPDQLRLAVQQASKAGFRAFRVPLLAPEGPARGRSFYRQALKLLEGLREAAGPDADFVLDCRGRAGPAEAAALAREFERFHLLWLDEPVALIDRKALAKIGEETVTPVGYGREITDNHEFLDLLRRGSIDVLRPDVGRNGITLIRKAAALAETYYVAVAPTHHGGPIGTAAALHVAASIPNFFIQELPFPADEKDRQMRRELAGDIETVKDGFFQLPAGPGLGVSLNDEAVKKYQVSGGR